MMFRTSSRRWPSRIYRSVISWRKVVHGLVILERESSPCIFSSESYGDSDTKVFQRSRSRSSIRLLKVFLSFLVFVPRSGRREVQLLISKVRDEKDEGVQVESRFQVPGPEECRS